MLYFNLCLGLSGDKFHFDVNGDGPARYNIIHFKQLSPGNFQWVRVGEYMEGELRMNMSGIMSFKLKLFENDKLLTFTK